jgi:hypothetical protein
MNPLVLLPLLAAAVVAAPGGIALNALPVQHIQTVQQVQVPLQQTVHYESRPVVTGYSSTILKPSIVQQTVAQPLLAQQVVSGLNLRQFEPPAFPPLEPPMGLPNNTADYPQFPGIPTQPPAGNSSDNPTPTLPPPPAFPTPSQSTPVFYQLNNPYSQFVAPVVQQQIVQARVAQPVVQAVAAPAQIAVAQPYYGYQQVVQAVQPVVQAPVVQVAQVRAAQAGDFGPLVTKEQVLAPVRQNTVVTPQVTQVQPELQVRRVPIDVPVAQPVYQTPVIHQTVVAQPQVLTSQVVAQPQLLQSQFVGQSVIGGQVLNGQVLGGVQGVRVISA